MRNTRRTGTHGGGLVDPFVRDGHELARKVSLELGDAAQWIVALGRGLFTDAAEIEPGGADTLRPRNEVPHEGVRHRHAEGYVARGAALRILDVIAVRASPREREERVRTFAVIAEDPDQAREAGGIACEIDHRAPILGRVSPAGARQRLEHEQLEAVRIPRIGDGGERGRSLRGQLDVAPSRALEPVEDRLLVKAQVEHERLTVAVSYLERLEPEREEVARIILPLVGIPRERLERETKHAWIALDGVDQRLEGEWTKR